MITSVTLTLLFLRMLLIGRLSTPCPSPWKNISRFYGYVFFCVKFGQIGFTRPPKGLLLWLRENPGFATVTTSWSRMANVTDVNRGSKLLLGVMRGETTAQEILDPPFATNILLWLIFDSSLCALRSCSSLFCWILWKRSFLLKPTENRKRSHKVQNSKPITYKHTNFGCTMEKDEIEKEHGMNWNWLTDHCPFHSCWNYRNNNAF